MEKIQYVDSNELDRKIEKSGLKVDFIVNTLGLSRQGFHKKRTGVTPFKAAEIYVLCDLLKISNDDEKNKIFCPKG